MRDNKRNANNAGIGNKLVTIFARHLDSFIMTINLSLIYQFFSGSGQILQRRQPYRSPGLAKIAPYPPCTGTVIWLACRRVPGQLPDAASGNAYYPYQRAVRFKIFSTLPRHPTRKQEFGSSPPRQSPLLPNTCFFCQRWTFKRHLFYTINIMRSNLIFLFKFGI
jgi:hypothetical protein